MSSSLGGVLLRYGDPEGRECLGFIAADVAARISGLSARRSVPGLPAPASGIALADGEVVTVLELGSAANVVQVPLFQAGEDWALPGADRAVICTVFGQRVAITGGTLVATGVFEAAAEGDGAILWRGERVAPLDVRALYRRAEAAIWEHRARRARVPAEEGT